MASVCNNKRLPDYLKIGSVRPPCHSSLGCTGLVTIGSRPCKTCWGVRIRSACVLCRQINAHKTGTLTNQSSFFFPWEGARWGARHSGVLHSPGLCLCLEETWSKGKEAPNSNVFYRLNHHLKDMITRVFFLNLLKSILSRGLQIWYIHSVQQ